MIEPHKRPDRLVSLDLRAFIVRRVDRLPACGGRSMLYDKLYETAVDMRAAGHVEPYVEKRLAEIFDAVGAIAAAAEVRV